MSSEVKRVSLFGSTGSVGQSAARVIASAPERFDVQVVTANRNVQKLAETALRLKARKAVIADPSLYKNLKTALGSTKIELAAGSEAVEDAAGEPADIILAAILGIAGLKPIMKAIGQGTCVAIANKEPLVAAGPLVMRLAEEKGTSILPVDSEHNAIFQVFEKQNRDTIEKIILTASGGPFWKLSREEMAKVTPEQAVKHPNWVMGQKISVDSATMMNKALEIIEAHHLFNMPPEKIDVLVHPQSVVHSMVEYEDGSIKAQLGASDMCTPIAYALAWPERMQTPGERLDWTQMHLLEFHPPDFKKFPALRLAYECLHSQESAASCITLNAANEMAVEAFLKKRIGFLDIERCVAYALEKKICKSIETIEDVTKLDQNVRHEVEAFLLGLTGS